jgi:hypothetical protein
VRLGDETANAFRKVLPGSPQKRLLSKKSYHVIQATQVSVRPRLAGIFSDVKPDIEQVFASAKPTKNARHDSGAALAPGAGVRDDFLHVEWFGGAAIKPVTDSGPQCLKLQFFRFATIRQQPQTVTHDFAGCLVSPGCHLVSDEFFELLSQ